MRKLNPPSLRLLITLIVVIPIVAVSAALVAISTITSRNIAEDLGDSLVGSATARVAGEVRSYLGGAIRVSDLYAHRIAHRDLPTGGADLTSGLQKWEQPMLADLLASPDVASICFGNVAGDATWLLRAHGRLEVGRADGSRDNHAVEYVMNADGSIAAEPIRVYQYDPRKRPWYSAATSASGPVWTPVYFWFGEQGGESETGIGYTRAIHGANAELRGVLVIDVTLSSLSRFLRSLPLASSGQVFILDDQNYLVAASRGAVNSSDGQRLMLSQAGSDAARELAAHLSNLDGEAMRRVSMSGQPARARVTPLKPYPGIQWRVVTILPESTFLSDAIRVQRQSILMALVAILGGLVLGLMLSRRLSRPMMSLTEHVRRVGQGDFESRLHLDGARELREVSAELNRMSGGLKQRMELEHSMRLAMTVQQSLLPRKPPQPPGLDIAAHSTYCDATGGDYYDFIDVSQLPGRGGTLVAIGDVMGHGIGAALLMATARAAVRASVATQPTLGHVMRAVNTVLTRDAHHGMFMTMTLMVIDPQSRSVRYVSAGHDPISIFDPAGQAFCDLTESEIPLGIEEIEYQESVFTGLPTGAVLVAGTDGIWEARNAQDEMYGKDRLRDVISASAHLPAQQIADALNRSLRDFVGDAPITDDVTFVIVKLYPARFERRELAELRNAGAAPTD